MGVDGGDFAFPNIYPISKALNVYRVPKPTWEAVHNVDKDTVSMKPVIDAVHGQMWEIEEHILVTSVIDLLRSKGYTVIEPTTDSI